MSILENHANDGALQIFLLLGITAENSFNKHGVLFSSSVQIASYENFLMVEPYALNNESCVGTNMGQFFLDLGSQCFDYFIYTNIHNILGQTSIMS